jgi:hypothetical protein
VAIAYVVGLSIGVHLLNMLSHSARWRAVCTHRQPVRRHR